VPPFDVPGEGGSFPTHLNTKIKTRRGRERERDLDARPRRRWLFCPYAKR